MKIQSHFCIPSFTSFFFFKLSLHKQQKFQTFPSCPLARFWNMFYRLHLYICTIVFTCNSYICCYYDCNYVGHNQTAGKGLYVLFCPRLCMARCQLGHGKSVSNMLNRENGSYKFGLTHKVFIYIIPRFVNYYRKSFSSLLQFLANSKYG